MIDQVERALQSAARPMALVWGEPVLRIPNDLYIPPDALEILLDAFSGPLDLLLYLIKRQNINILDIPVAEITRQYLTYIDLMQAIHLELAAEYLAMAATLAEIKSRMLLPKPAAEGEDGETDPRAELARRLLEYEQIKQAAQALDNLPRLERDIYAVDIEIPDFEQVMPLPSVDLGQLTAALNSVLAHQQLYTHHQIAREPLSVRERMAQLLIDLNDGDAYDFCTLLQAEEGRLGVVVCFLAILELSREALIELIQADAQGPIFVRQRQ